MKFCVLLLGLLGGSLAYQPKLYLSNNFRFAGGQNSFPGQYPWIVSVEVTNFQQGWPICAGTLLHPQWVLTAAHCLDSEKPEWMWVVTGENDRTILEGSEQYLTVDYFVKHPEYIYWEKPYKNDLGLIHLATPARLDAYTSLAPIPAQPDALTGPCIEAGWGATGNGALGSETLKWAQVELLDRSQCERVYDSKDQNTLCAGTLSGGQGACAVDNGVGLVCVGGDGSLVVAAVMSWRDGCARPGFPAVYMDIAKYRNWISNIIYNYNN